MLRHEALTSITLLVAFIVGPFVARAANPAPYQITLRPIATVPGAIVRLSDIAEISGPDAVVCAAISRLDIEDTPTNGKSLAITKEHVEYRLKLAKAPAGTIDVHGQRVMVTAGRPSNSLRNVSGNSGDTASPSIKPAHEKRFEAAQRPAPSTNLPTAHRSAQDRVGEVARSAVLARLPWDPRDVTVEVTHVGSQAESLTSSQLDTLAADIKSAWPPIGRVQTVVKPADARLEDPGVLVILNVKHYREMVIAKNAIEMGRTVEAQDVFVDRREVKELGVAYAHLDDVVGKPAAKPIAGLQVIRKVDLKSDPIVTAPPTAAKVQSGTVIRRGDTVKMTARGGALAISVTAKALQDGAIGDVIRVENLDSKKAISGRVTARGEVETDF